MRFSLQRIKLLFLFVVVVTIAAGVILSLRDRPSADPRTAYYRALEIGLTETAVTCTTQQTTDTSSLKQSVQLDLQQPPIARTITTATEAGNTVSTEELSLPSGTYVRYTAITTKARDAAGKAPDFRDVLNVWSKTSRSSTASGQSVYGRTVLGNCIVPLASLNESKAEPLIDELRKGAVFQTDFKQAKTMTMNREKVISYKVSVQPRPYIEFMKRVGTASGLNDLKSVDVSSYENKAAEVLQWYVSVNSNHLIRIDNLSSKRSVSFSDCGKSSQLTAPKTTISDSELQKRLQD